MADFYAELPISDQGHRQLPRHGRVRERRRAAAAHRDAERRRDRERQGHADAWTPSRKTFRYLDEEEIAKQRAAAEGRQGQGARNEARASLWHRCRALALLAGCGGESHQDLQRLDGASRARACAARSTRCRRSSRTSRSRTTHFDLPDPFKPRKIEPVKGEARASSRPISIAARSRSRPIPLESLSMVGTLEKGKTTLRAGEDARQATSTRYAGQLPGAELRRRSSASPRRDIKLKELVQDGAGDWAERSSTLQLLQADQKTQEHRK